MAKQVREQRKVIRTRVTSRRKKSNKLGMCVTIMASLIIVIAISIQNNKLEDKLEKLKEDEAKCLELLEKEQDRTKELEDKEKYIKTKAYVVEEAKKLGLIYPDEIIFKPK